MIELFFAFGWPFAAETEVLETLADCRVARSLQFPLIVAFCAVAALSGPRGGFLGRWKLLRSATLVVSVSYIVSLGIAIFRDFTPPYQQSAGSVESQWCAVAFAMILIQCFSLPEVRGLFTSEVSSTTPQYSECKDSGLRPGDDKEATHESAHVDNRTDEDSSVRDELELPDSKRSLRVLCVEDDMTQQTIVRMAFSSEHSIQFCTTAEDGMKYLRDVDGTEQFPDLVLMDNDLPGMDGYEATGQIQSVWSNLPVFSHTSRTDTDIVTESYVAGARHYINKPLNRQKLIEYIQPYFPGTEF